MIRNDLLQFVFCIFLSLFIGADLFVFLLYRYIWIFFTYLFELRMHRLRTYKRNAK